MQTGVDACCCHASKQSDSRDIVPFCTNSLLYVDLIHGLPRFGGYDGCLVVTRGLSRFTRVFPCNKKITGEQTVKRERTKDWIRVVPWAVLTMNSQRSSSTGVTPGELFYGGRPAWFFKTTFPENFKSPVEDWLEHKQSMANQAGTNLRHIGDRELSRRNRLQRPASFMVGDLVLVHHSRLPSWPRNCLQDPYFGPYRIIRIDGSWIHVRL